MQEKTIQVGGSMPREGSFICNYCEKPIGKRIYYVIRKNDAIVRMCRECRCKLVYEQRNNDL